MPTPEKYDTSASSFFIYEISDAARISRSSKGWALISGLPRFRSHDEYALHGEVFYTVYDF